MSAHLRHTCRLVVLFVLLAGTAASAGEAPGRFTRPVAPRPDGDLRILLYYDMEGVSGQDIVTSIDFPRPEYFAARELLTADINAVVAGLCDGGATVIDVVDAHGSFNPEPDVIVERMDPRAEMLYRTEKFHPYIDLTEPDAYDAVVAVCMHARTGSGGFASHTVHLGTDWIMNGEPITESDILAFSWGRVGVPLILVTGDDVLGDELAWMGWLEYVTVKTAQAFDRVTCRPVDEVHAEMRAKAARAVRRLDRARTAHLATPVAAALRAEPPADLSLLEGLPGLDYADQRVDFTATDFLDAYHTMRRFMDVADTGYLAVLQRTTLSGPDAQVNFQAWKDAIFAGWTEAATQPAATDTPSPAAVTAKAPEPAPRWFGSR